MKEKTKEMLERELEAAKHLLDSRAGQIKALQQEVAGEAEVTRLLTGFLPLLALAAARDGAANEAVRITGSRDVIGISVDKESLAAVLGRWQIKTVNADSAYRVAFERVKDDAARG